MQRMVVIVMTIIGEDRPGLVDTVSSLVAEHGGNWLESRMARLGGQFAGILRIEAPEDKEQALREGLHGLSEKGLAVVAHVDVRSAELAPVRLCDLDIVGQDRPGIVRQISHALASYGINVEDLHTECSSAAMSGETLFKARARLSLSAHCQVVEVRQTLEKIAADLIVDISLAEVQGPEAG